MTGPSSAGTPSFPGGEARVPWKSVALPTEHGGWGLLVEPLALGLVVAPSFAGVCLAAAALAGFLARHPLRLFLMDRRKGARYPRTRQALRLFAGEAVVALSLLAAAFVYAAAPFWMALGAALPFALVAVLHDALGRSRAALAEAGGGIALSASAAAIALAGGAAVGVAFGAWTLLALHALTSVLYIRARLRLDRSQPAGPGLALASHLAALAVAAWLARLQVAPWLGVAAFALLFGRAAWGLSVWRRRARPQQLGFEELGYGVLTLVLLAAGYLGAASGWR